MGKVFPHVPMSRTQVIKGAVFHSILSPFSWLDTVLVIGFISSIKVGPDKFFCRWRSGSVILVVHHTDGGLASGGFNVTESTGLARIGCLCLHIHVFAGGEIVGRLPLALTCMNSLEQRCSKKKRTACRSLFCLGG
jgi:hypothetical protein